MRRAGGAPRGSGGRWRVWAAAAAATLLLELLVAAPAAACEVCFGARENGSPLVTGARLGVFLLLGVTVAMLGGFATFFFYLRQRARKAESEGLDAEWAQLQRRVSS